MPFNLLLLPLLGGFIFTRYWNKTYYETLRAENERLLLVSSAWGFIFLVIAFAITSYTRTAFPWWDRWWNAYVPFPYSGTSCLAFLLGALGWIPLNLFYRREDQVSKLTEENGDRFELLLKKAQDEAKMVSITLKNGKFYTGFVKASLNPANRIKSVGIIPTRSGYRDNEKKSLVFTFEYATVFDQLVNEYDKAEAEMMEKRRELESRMAYRNTKAEEMKRVSEEARSDMIIEPNTLKVMGEVYTIDEEINELHKQIVALEDTLDKIADGLDDYETIIPVDEISILSIYNHDFYQKYFATQRAEQP